MSLLDGWTIHPTRHLRRPRLEKESGAGYINLSARERNRKTLAEAQRIYTMPIERRIIVPDWFLAEFMAAIEKASLPCQKPKRLTDEEIDELYARVVELQKAGEQCDLVIDEIRRAERQRAQEMRDLFGVDTDDEMFRRIDAMIGGVA